MWPHGRNVTTVRIPPPDPLGVNAPEKIPLKKKPNPQVLN